MDERFQYREYKHGLLSALRWKFRCEWVTERERERECVCVCVCVW